MKEVKDMVEEYTKKCPWCPLALLIGGGVMFVLGFILSAPMIKTLWLLLGIVALAVGGAAFYLTSTQKKGAAPKPPAAQPKAPPKPEEKPETEE